MKKWWKIKSQENGWESGTLTHSNIHIKIWWHKQVPRVPSSSAYKIVREKLDDLRVKIYFLQNKGKKIIVEQGEKLGNIKSKGASWQIFDPPYVNKVSQYYACISCGLILESTKLALMDEVVGDCLKLEPIANYFFD